MNKKIQLFEFYLADTEREEKKDKKKFARVLRKRKKAVSLRPRNKGTGQEARGDGFDGSLKEWNGCSK